MSGCGDRPGTICQTRWSAALTKQMTSLSGSRAHAPPPYSWTAERMLKGSGRIRSPGPGWDSEVRTRPVREFSSGIFVE
ncbi:hypothetical protein IOD13_10660 [Brevibacterium casei]|nr:hypothetical protein [Brevibacterium casei]